MYFIPQLKNIKRNNTIQENIHNSENHVIIMCLYYNQIE